LQFFFDDQIISTQQVSADGTYSTTYSPSASGSHAFKAQVTDQGYYQADDSQTVNVTGGGGGGSSFHIISPSEGSTVPRHNVVFKWSDDGSSSFTLQVTGPTNFSKTTGANSYTQPTLLPGPYSWTITSSNGHSDGGTFFAS
jgi:hypothetical protein